MLIIAEVVFDSSVYNELGNNVKYLIYILLLYFIGALEFLGSIPLLQFCHYFFLALALGAFVYYFVLKRISTVAIFVGLYCFVFPVYAAFQSHEIFGQPFFMGFASLRYLWFILLGFFLYNIKYDYNLLLSQINKINITIAVVSIIAFFFLGMNHMNVQQYLVTTNIVETEASEDMVKGLKLTVCSNLMIVSYVFYLLRFVKRPTEKRNFLPFIILMIYLLFVNKGRQPVALLAVVYAIYYIRMKGLSPRRLALGILPLVGAVVILSVNDKFFDSLIEATKWEKSSDSSTLARVNSVESVIPYIERNPILGFGNLSVHFRDEGFHTYFGRAFYLADIGIWGTLARGGLVLILIYLGLYYNIYKKTVGVQNNDIRIFMRYMLLSFLILLVVLSNDTLYAEGCLRIALVFYPLFGRLDPNIFIKNRPL